jgi:hypothetical protein
MSSSILIIIPLRVVRHITQMGMCILRAVRRVKQTGRPLGAQQTDSTVLLVRLRLPTLPRMKHRNPLRGLPPVTGADLRDLGPVHVCICGSQVFNVAASFDDFELSWYFLDATCFSCGALVRVPCEPDRYEAQPFTD